MPTLARPITTDMRGTKCLTCGGSRSSLGFAALSRAAAKAAGARLRRLGALSTHPQWAARAAVCERCPVRVGRAGVSYCGTPFLNRLGADVERDPADGCGCPTREKARDPSEHCPLDGRHRPAARAGAACNCKWCEMQE